MDDRIYVLHLDSETIRQPSPSPVIVSQYKKPDRESSRVRRVVWLGVGAGYIPDSERHLKFVSSMVKNDIPSDFGTIKDSDRLFPRSYFR